MGFASSLEFTMEVEMGKTLNVHEIYRKALFCMHCAMISLPMLFSRIFRNQIQTNRLWHFCCYRRLVHSWFSHFRLFYVTEYFASISNPKEYHCLFIHMTEPPFSQCPSSICTTILRSTGEKVLMKIPFDIYHTISALYCYLWVFRYRRGRSWSNDS